mmetsp:Transcript_653/g.1337  ORF Transcript_653/g.1337 Transcript_653/m.1337 type:complete len:187 (-) Transcript_653:23-583(-)
MNLYQAAMPYLGMDQSESTLMGNNFDREAARRLTNQQRPGAGQPQSQSQGVNSTASIQAMHPGNWVMPVQSRTTQYRSRTDFEFPYHSPAYGCGFRYHYPDSLDDTLQLTKLRRPTGLDGLAHMRFVQALENEWGHASIRETAYGVSRRAPPGSRRLRESELMALQARERQEYEEMQQESFMNAVF